jgi:hypothetical protein
MPFDLVDPGFAPYSPPSDDDIREIHLFDLSDCHITTEGDVFIDPNDDLYPSEAEPLDTESLGPLALPPSDHKGLTQSHT